MKELIQRSFAAQFDGLPSQFSIEETRPIRETALIDISKICLLF